MTRRLIAFGLLFLIAAPARADQVAEFNADLGKVVGAFNAAQLYVEQCDLKDPSNAQDRRDVLAGWSYANSRSSYDRLMEGIHARLPDIVAQITRERERLVDVIAQAIGKNPQQCDDLMKLFKDDQQFSVERSVRRLVRSASNLGIVIPDAPEIAPRQKSADEISIVRLAALSARLEARMTEIGSKEGAERYRDLSSARERHAEDWLAADGIQLLFGRVTDDDELREWRGDLQSSFKVECDTFASDEHETRMAQAVGQDRVILGTPRSVLDAHTGGKLTLRKCSVFTPEETGRPFEEEDDTAGLMPRPMEEGEAYAGPNQGIAMSAVERVLYEASFDNRLDGFGNGYVDRDEAIYVLMNDGSAYRHEWSFPFTDLDVERSKEREPERWYTWSDSGGTVTLTYTGGEDKGSTLELEKPQNLRPMTPQRLQARYYYLQVGMGGVRHDRSYAFADDGTLTYNRSGFVAGNVATSYIIVSGPDEKAVTANYHFEDYALIIERNGEIERHFLAVPEGADETLPDTLLIRGEAYWVDKK